MPNARTHRNLNFIFLALLGWIAWQYLAFSVTELAEFAAVFTQFTTVYSPDMDLKSAHAYRSWGMLRILWWPYARLFRHRGISHLFIVGTLTRISYTLILVISLWGSIFTLITWLHNPESFQFSTALYNFGNQLLDFEWQRGGLLQDWLHQEGQRYIIILPAGVFIPDLLHWIQDKIL